MTLRECAGHWPVLTPELAMTVASVHWSALETEYERWCIPSVPRLLKDTKLTPLAICDTDELLVTEPETQSGDVNAAYKEDSDTCEI